jgi:hypothetical protein
MEYKKGEQPKGEQLVTIEGTGENKHLPKGSIHQVPQAEADALIASGRAKASKKEAEAAEVQKAPEITPEDVDNDAANKEQTDAEARARVDGAPGKETKEEKFISTAGKQTNKK